MNAAALGESCYVATLNLNLWVDGVGWGLVGIDIEIIIMYFHRKYFSIQNLQS